MNSSLLSDMFFAAPELWYSVFAVFAALIFWGAAEYVRLLQEKRRNYFIRRDRDRYEETLYACRDGYFAFIYPDDRVNDAASGISERCSRRLAVLLNLDGGVETPFTEVLRSFYKDDADKIAKYVALLKEDGVSFEDRFDLKNGRKLILNGVRISGADGSVYSDVVWFRDISYIAVKIDALQNEKQEAERRERDLRDLVDNLPYPVWMRTPDSEIKTVNRKYREYAGAGGELGGGEIRELAAAARPGDIFVAGKNFGCGSSREFAPACIAALGVRCIVAKSFARIFYRNGINNGMLLIETDDLYDRCEEGDLLTVEVNRCLKVNGQVIPIRQIPDNLFEIIKAGGLVPRYRALNEAAEAAESVQKEVH